MSTLKLCEFKLIYTGLRVLDMKSNLSVITDMRFDKNRCGLIVYKI